MPRQSREQLGNTASVAMSQPAKDAGQEKGAEVNKPKISAGTVLAAGTGAVAAGAVALALLPIGAANAARITNQQQRQAGTITIQSWVHTPLTENGLTATAWQCSKISGVITDQSGGPTWQDDAQYAAPTQMTGAAATAAAAKECATTVPSGGIVLVPPPEPGQYALGTYTATPGATSPSQYTGLSSFYSQQTILGQRGTIYLTIASTYNVTGSPVDVNGVEVQPGRTGPEATFVITGGTGAYAGLQGSGTWQGDFIQPDWCYRLATLKVWYVGQ